MNSMIHKAYLMLFFCCTHFSLFSMQPQGFRLIQRWCQQLSAHITRPGHVHVFMNDAKMVSLAPDAKKPIIISTAGLIGCIATVLHARDITGNQHALLMHFHPNYHKEHLMELERQILLLKDHHKTFKSMNFLSILPRDNYWLDQELHTPDCHKRRNALENAVQKSSLHQNIKMLHADYRLAPTGKGYFTEVHVTLANDTPSRYKVDNWIDWYNCELE